MHGKQLIVVENVRIEALGGRPGMTGKSQGKTYTRPWTDRRLTGKGITNSVT